MRSPEPPPSRADKAESIAGIILGSTGTRTPGSAVWAVLATVALHAAAGAFAWRAARNRASGAPVAAPKQALRIDHVVDLQPPAPPAPPPPPPPRQQPREARAEPPTSRARSHDRAPAPAQAGAVVAVKEAEAPLDFTGFDITSGQASHYAGGVTASNGTSTQAVESLGSAESDTPSRARPVQLPGRLWSCPWPGEADALRIDEQSVELRVNVTIDGTVSSAELVSDPGYGFGRAALSCVRSVRFVAALDRDGRPREARSPLIRIRFKRR